eukprot:m.10468 g.10468  ORF g.10468 m.10468 type:complete len:230 (-) comp7049_c0_seq2:872-1561(-)
MYTGHSVWSRTLAVADCTLDLYSFAQSTPRGSTSSEIPGHAVPEQGAAAVDVAPAVTPVATVPIGPIPLVCVRLDDATHRAVQHRQLHGVRRQLLALTSIEFTLRRPPALDTVTVVWPSGGRGAVDAHEGRSDEGEDDVAAVVVSFLRRHVWAPWIAIDPDLDSVCGSFECFNPGIGTNIGWHQDGWAPGCFLMCVAVVHTHLASVSRALPPSSPPPRRIILDDPTPIS